MELHCEGIVSFPSRCPTSYRYKLLRDADRVKICLNDRSSYHEWESDSLSITDLPQLKIPGDDATLDNYVSILQSGLETVTQEGSSECQRDLVDADDGCLRLEFNFLFGCFSVVWNQKICVELKPVKLEPIQYAEAKIRDLEEQLRVLAAEKEQDRVAKEERRVLILEYASSNSTIQIGGVLGWKRCIYDINNTKHFHIRGNGCVVVHTGGYYVISLVIHHSSQKDIGSHFELRYGKVRNQFTVASALSTSLLSKIVYLEEHAVVRVVSRIVTGVVKGTTLSIVPVVYR